MWKGTFPKATTVGTTKVEALEKTPSKTKLKEKELSGKLVRWSVNVYLELPLILPQSFIRLDIEYEITPEFLLWGFLLQLVT